MHLNTAHDALTKALLCAVHDGRRKLMDDKTGQELAGPAPREAAARHVDAAIDNLSAAGILR